MKKLGKYSLVVIHKKVIPTQCSITHAASVVSTPVKRLIFELETRGYFETQNYRVEIETEDDD